MTTSSRRNRRRTVGKAREYISAYIDADLRKRIDDSAESDGISVSAKLEQLLARGLADAERQSPRRPAALAS